MHMARANYTVDNVPTCRRLAITSELTGFEALRCWGPRESLTYRKPGHAVAQEPTTAYHARHWVQRLCLEHWETPGQESLTNL